jgi:hypothetical protein
MAKGPASDVDGVRTLVDEPGQLFLFAWKNILIFVWHGDAPVELMRKLGPVFEAQARDHGRLSVVSIVGNVGQLPDESRRQAYREFLVAHGAKFAHLALVLEREGFIGSAIRGLVTGLLVVTRQQHTVHVASTVQEVANWLPAKHAASTGVELDPAQLVRVLTRARAQAASRTSSDTAR